MSFIKELAESALKDSYLTTLIYKLEIANSKALFDVPEINRLTAKEYHDILRFADILSRSNISEARNEALKIISLLHEDDQYKRDDSFKLFASSVLMKLGNFPSLEILGGVDDINDEEVIREKIVKSIMQLSPDKKTVFTDAQYNIFERLKDSNNYSFSGPTSFGKSFIMESFIEYIITKGNASDNIVVLVPTRALINQVTSNLRDKFSGDYEIISHPKVPLLYKAAEKKYIFVFTAERLVSYLSDSDNPIINYLFVDEAHKLLNNDSRTPLLYHTLYQASRRGVKLYFASPNIPNSGIFLDLFNRSSEDSLTTTESPVTQSRYFVDCLKGKIIIFSDYGAPYELKKSFGRGESESLKNMITQLGGYSQNIVYCNTINYTIETALNFSKVIEPVENKKVMNLIKLVNDTVHEKYFLIDCLKKGVAFHYGGIPQRIREKIEELFRNGDIRYLFCTSTLLEGVNLPAKNIFILSSKKGQSAMNNVDFWNLAGRAGRLTKDLGGNIFCCNVFDKKGYWNEEKELDILKNKKIDELEPVILRKNDKNLYKNINNFLNDKQYTNKNLSNDAKKSIESYGNILFYQSLFGGDSVLLSKFLDKNRDIGRETLKKIKSSNKVSQSTLFQSPNIKFNIQNEIISQDLKDLPDDMGYEGCLEMLDILYDKYRWNTEEEGGRKPLIPQKVEKKILKYYALLIQYWVSSKPLSYIISQAIKYYEDNGSMVEVASITQARHFEVFDSKDRGHINEVINDLMRILENDIRFKIKGYVRNYMLLLNEQGVEAKNNWADYLEYGSTNKLMIEIQNVGFPRNLANFLKEYHEDCFKVEDGEIISFDLDKLRKDIDQEEFLQEYEELSEILNWNIDSHK